MNSAEDNKIIEEVGKDTIDALRGALGDNPCVLGDEYNEIYWFSDPDLARAFKKALEAYNVEA